MDGISYAGSDFLTDATVTLAGAAVSDGAPAKATVADGNVNVKITDAEEAYKLIESGAPITVTVTFDTNNYGDNNASTTGDNVMEITLTVVDKETATIIFNTNANETTYNGAAQNPGVPTVTLAEDDAADMSKLTYTIIKDDKTFTDGFTGMKDAGTYEIVAKYEDDTYAGESDKYTFIITPATLTITGGTVTAKTYDGKTNAVLTGETLTSETVSNVALVKDTDYTITGVQFADANAGTNKAVSYQVALKDTAAARNYTLDSETGSTTGTINPKAVTATVAAIVDQIYNHGANITPDVSVSIPDVIEPDTLTAGTDYTVAISNNVSVGNAVITISDVAGGNYTVSGTGSFKIIPYAVTVPDASSDLTYDGRSRTGVADGDYYGVIGGTATNAGAYNATVKLDNANYEWTDGTTADKTITWTIAPKSIEGVTVTGIEDKTYTGSAITQTFTVKDGSTTLESGTDYTVTYADNTNAGTAKVTVTGKDNYTGSVEETFEITKATPALDSSVETDTEDGTTVVVYSSDANYVCEILTASDFNGAGTLKWYVQTKNDAGETVNTEIDPEATMIDDVDGTLIWVYTEEESENYTAVTLTGTAAEEVKLPWWPIIDTGSIGTIGGASDPIDAYIDLDANAWYADAVRYCLDEGLMSGVSKDKFNPNGGMTRAMVWTVLGRISGEKFNGTGADWYVEAQNWAMRNGISDGTNPDGLVTREELVTMLWRYAGSPEADTAVLQRYNDNANISDWAEEAMAWAVSIGLVEGSNRNLMPTDTSLRCQVAAIFMRYTKYF